MKEIYTMGDGVHQGMYYKWAMAQQLNGGVVGSIRNIEGALKALKSAKKPEEEKIERLENDLKKLKKRNEYFEKELDNIENFYFKGLKRLR
ncbi:MAG: hypothetical protein HF967_08685 [Methanosarcinales archaeon]|nr:hypothetical protein [Methanosarcinales archaeon]